MTRNVPRQRLPEEAGRSASPNAVPLYGPNGQPIRMIDVDNGVNVTEDHATRERLHDDLRDAREQFIDDLRGPRGWKHGSILDTVLVAMGRGTSWEDRFPQTEPAAGQQFVDALTESARFELENARYIHHNPEHDDGRHVGEEQSSHDENDIVLDLIFDQVHEILELPERARRGRVMGEFAAYVAGGAVVGAGTAEVFAATHPGLIAGVTTVAAVASATGAASSMKLNRQKYDMAIPTSHAPMVRTRRRLFSRREDVLPLNDGHTDRLRESALDIVKERTKSTLESIGFSNDMISGVDVERGSRVWLTRREQTQSYRENMVLSREERERRQIIEEIGNQARGADLDELRTQAAWELSLHELRNYQNEGYEDLRKSRRRKAIGGMLLALGLTFTLNAGHSAAEHDKTRQEKIDKKQQEPTPDKPDKTTPGDDFNNAPAQTTN